MRTRSGFTLIELLVVISILAMLMAIVLPATGQIRDAARRTQCGTQMREIAIACKNFASSSGDRLPPGVATCNKYPEQWKLGGSQIGNICQGSTWLTAILSEAGEPKLANFVTQCLVASGDCWNVTDDAEHEEGSVGEVTPPFMICPAAPRMTRAERLGESTSVYGLEQLSKGNYAACFGDDTLEQAVSHPNTPQARAARQIHQGAFRVSPLQHHTIDLYDPKITFSQDDPRMRGPWKLGKNVGVGLAEIRDGHDKTLLISEVIGYDSQQDGRGVWICAAMGSSTFTAKTPPNANGNYNPDYYDQVPMCARNIPPTDPLHCKQSYTTDAKMWAAARSTHPGGVNAAHVDASMKFYSNATDLTVWKALATRHGLEREGAIVTQ